MNFRDNWIHSSCKATPIFLRKVEKRHNSLSIYLMINILRLTVARRRLLEGEDPIIKFVYPTFMSVNNKNIKASINSKTSFPN